ncbi:MAG TPA: phosphoribosylamine--glycine ligase [Candidatus Eisenbacteria bacterium]|nr:phosphoribosylamine--glycine ligase [Candidatus Eisenbacteria bacterium]
MSEPRILVVGQGGREHALVDALHRSPEHPKIFVAPGSPGMEPLAERVAIDAGDVPSLMRWVSTHAIDLVVVGPEIPLERGLADALREAHVPVLGPGKDGARLETSKVFAKELFRKAGLPSASFQVARSAEEAERMVAASPLPIVLKADGLAAGKGVVVATTRDEAMAAIDSWMKRGALGDSGRTLVIEEFLAGEEASILLLTDGERWVLFPPARDHKRLQDGDTGPNTGGMGACSPARVPTPEDAKTIAHALVDPLLATLRAEGTPYRGILYLGLMLTAKGPQILEVNARFGDPEAQAVLPLLTEDLIPLADAAARGRLPAERHGTFVAHEGAAVCVVLAAHGYPASPESGAVIEGLNGPWPHGICIYHAGVARRGGQWVASGGRVLGVTARSETLEQARVAAYQAVARIQFHGMQYRKDIAQSPQTSGASRP